MDEEKTILINLNCVEDQDPSTVNDQLSKRDNFLHNLLHIICLNKLSIAHLDTRFGKSFGQSCLLVVNLNNQLEINQFCDKITQHEAVRNVQIISDELKNKNMWVPRHISDLDHFRTVKLKFQPELQTDHPGFHDQEYRNRRAFIAEIAFNFRHNKFIPTVEYTEKEIDTWNKSYTTLKRLHSLKACKEYIKGFKLLEKYCGYCPDKIPQLQTVSEFLQRTCGFRIHPVTGLVSSRDFLANFAYRVFPSTQYVRHHSRPLHTPEPDCIHELLGHMPLLTDPEFSDFSQQIGLASLGASDEEIEKLATVYWFTVEFGLCREDGNIKAFGAGLMSSYGELENAFQDNSVKLDFEPQKTAVQKYDDVGYQPIYFVVDSIPTMKRKLLEYVKNMPRTEFAVYDPITQSVTMMTKMEYRTHVIKQISQIVQGSEWI